MLVFSPWSSERSPRHPARTWSRPGLGLGSVSCPYRWSRRRSPSRSPVWELLWFCSAVSTHWKKRREAEMSLAGKESSSTWLWHLLNTIHIFNILNDRIKMLHLCSGYNFLDYQLIILSNLPSVFKLLDCWWCWVNVFWLSIFFRGQISLRKMSAEESYIKTHETLAIWDCYINILFLKQKENLSDSHLNTFILVATKICTRFQTLVFSLLISNKREKRKRQRDV